MEPPTTLTTREPIRLSPDEENLLSRQAKLIDNYKRLLEESMTRPCSLEELFLKTIGTITSLNQSTTYPNTFRNLNAVPKTIVRGPKGGQSYVNSRGNTIWLKREQKIKCAHNQLVGAQGTCELNQ